MREINKMRKTKKKEKKKEEEKVGNHWRKMKMWECI